MNSSSTIFWYNHTKYVVLMIGIVSQCIAYWQVVVEIYLAFFFTGNGVRQCWHIRMVILISVS